ncbi:MAG TPA: hypothetical protein VLA59_10410 [Patescibacteria group bacterium]|nr:hypothetical protein [Patescibacteria group bacterium]
MALRLPRFLVRPLLGAMTVAILAACSATASPSATPFPSLVPVASPGEALGALPGVEGYQYILDLDSIPAFLGNTRESIGGEVEIQIIQSAIAAHETGDVSVVAFGFPDATDEQAVDYFGRVLDKMEDGFGAGSQRGLEDRAYLMRRDGRTVVLAPWGRLDYLVFLLAVGPTETTEDLVIGILDAGR